MLRASESIIAIVCSVAARVLPSGALATMIPFRVAASTSMLSTPTPARPMNFIFFACLDHLCIDIGAAAHQQGIVVPDNFAELVFLKIGFDVNVNGRPEDRKPFFRQRIADEHSCICHKNPYSICAGHNERYSFKNGQAPFLLLQKKRSGFLRDSCRGMPTSDDNY